MKKRITRSVFLLFVCAVLFLISAASADRLPEKPYNYIGAMRVVWCDEWVSLREKPKKTSERLAEVPLGAIVYNCMDINNSLFYKCEYEGQSGYILKGYLMRAPEYEPPESSALSKRMSMEEVVGNGKVVLEWKDFNMSVIAAHEYTTEKKKEWEILRIGCFIDGLPVWGHEEKCEAAGQYELLKAFIGGTEDDWQVMLFDGAYGLSMLDMLSGKELWTLSVLSCPMGNAAATAVDTDGTIYIAGTDGPDPVAVSMEGYVLWKSDVDIPGIFAPYEINVESNAINVKYENGTENGYTTVTISKEGEVISVSD